MNRAGGMSVLNYKEIKPQGHREGIMDINQALALDNGARFSTGALIDSVMSWPTKPFSMLPLTMPMLAMSILLLICPGPSRACSRAGRRFEALAHPKGRSAAEE
jgi:hypothetical protein